VRFGLPICLWAALLGVAAGPAAVPARAATRAVVTTTDYGVSGSVCDVADSSPWSARCGVATTASDAVVRWYGGRFYVVNRFGGDNIQVLDPSPAWHTALQFSVGAGSNPHDIAFASPTKAYVTRYDSPDLWIVNPATGAHTGTLSLAAFADSDGIPEMERAAIVGRRLFVALQLLNRANFYTATGSGLIVVIDTDADTVLDADPSVAGRQAIRLTGANPTTTLEFDRETSLLYVGETGAYGARDGGIESIDPMTLRAGGFAVTEDSLGGDVGPFRMTGGGCGYAIMSDPDFNTVLVRFDLAAHRRLTTVHASTGFALVDVNADDAGQVWVSDRSRGAPGLRVFDAATGVQRTGSPILTDLPPNSIAFDAPDSNGVPGTPEAGTLTARAVRGVFSSAVEFTVRGGQGARRARLVDVAGRALRTWELPGGPSEASLRWEGAAADGAPAPSGIFWLRVECGGEAASARVVRVR
jgi:DNA-binding beta-propeller fold protein YncE